MEKAFITFISFLYLVSGIGFGSVHHYCHYKHKMISPCESQCCSVEALSISSKAYQLPEKPDANSCYAGMATSLPTRGIERTSTDDCCAVQHTYNQLNSTSLPLNSDVSLVAKASGELHYYHTQQPQKIDGFALTVFTDPSAHVTLPLLI